MALVFNGTTQLASAAVAPATAVPLTLAAWAKRAAGSLGGVMELAQNPAGFDYFFLRFNADGTCRARARSLLNLGTADAPDVLGTGVWGHVAGVFGSSTSRYCYLNGVAGAEESSDVTPLTLTTTRIAWETGGDYYFDGELAHVCIWNAALSTAELLELARGASPLGIRPGNLVAYWPMLGADSLVIDESGNRNDLTPANSPTLAADGPPVGWRSVGRIYVPIAVSGAQSVNLDVATETDVAPTLTGRKKAALAVASETDAAPTLTGRKKATPAVASETDAAPALTAVKRVHLDVAVETDVAPEITAGGAIRVNLDVATETDVAPTLTGRKRASLAVASETDAAPTLTGRKRATLAVGSETDVAPALTPVKRAHLDAAVEVDVAPPITTGEDIVVNLDVATETDAAPGITPLLWIYTGPVKRCYVRAERVLEATLKSTTGTVRARLKDLTADLGVVGSEVCTAATVKTRLESDVFDLVVGHDYEVQAGHAPGDAGVLYGAEALVPT